MTSLILVYFLYASGTMSGIATFLFLMLWFAGGLTKGFKKTEFEFTSQNFVTGLIALFIEIMIAYFILFTWF